MARETSTESEIATELAGILQVHQEEIVASWMDSVQGLPGFHHSPWTPDELSSLALRGLRFMHQALIAGSYASASQDFDMQALRLPMSALRPGEISDVVWLIRAAVLPHIHQHAPTPSMAWELSSQLDQTLRWISSRRGWHVRFHVRG